MAEFECPVVRIEEISPIEGADRIEAVRIGGYRSIVMKGSYKVGDLAVYIPCGSLVPVSIQEELGLVGKLSGSHKNRVKEIKLKGTLSEGLVMSLGQTLQYVDKLGEDGDKDIKLAAAFNKIEGYDAAKALGIEKYEPPIPGSMMGQVKPYPFTMKYDIENIKKHPYAFKEGEIIVASEKVHGTLIQVGLIHNEDGTITKYVTSKGLGKAGLIIEDNEANASNLYIKTAKAFGLFDKLDVLDQGEDVYLFGEVFGKNGQGNIQDLTYTDSVSDEPKFRAFDIYEGKKERGRWLNVEEFVVICASAGIPTVNYFYQGPYSEQVLSNITNGLETMSGKGLHIREGVVIRPLIEREERRVGRLILKSVSEAYLLRKGNVTEYA